MNKTAQYFAHIPGWGIDADPKNDPTYPMRRRENDDHRGASQADRPPLQPVDHEVLLSIERPSHAAVLGNSVTPSGLSGMIRRFAFRYSENRYRHWLPLLLADKINVVEGIVDDLAHGHVPNIFAEKGYAVEWKHNRKTLVTKLAVGAVVATGLLLLLTSDSKEQKRKKRVKKVLRGLEG